MNPTTNETPNPKPVTAYCRTCGKALTEDTVRVAMGTVFCDEHLPAASAAAAGFTTPPATPAPVANPGVSPGLAFLLGLIPGVGSIYNGQYVKGFVHVVILGMLISILSSGNASGLEWLFGILIGVFYFYMPFEAYHTARKRQLGETVEEFSSLVPMNGKGAGFPVAPVLLMALGVLFLLNNFDLLRIRDLIRYWPAILIVLGGYLLYLRVRPEHSKEL